MKYLRPLSLLSMALLSAACGGEVLVRESVSADQALAPSVRARMSVEGIEVDGVVTPLPQGATLERDGVHSSGEVERVMLPGEQLIANESGAYVGVRAVDGTQTRFRPGARYAKGRLIGFPENAAKGVPLPRGARVVVSGTFKDGDVVPIGGSVESENSGGLVAVGTTIFGLGYVPSVVVAAESNYKPDRWLYLPLAGPWINLTNRPTCTPPAGTPVGVDPCKPEQVARVAMVTLGVVQGIGAVATLFGIPGKTVYTRPNGTVKSASISPWSLQGGGGVFVSGAF